MPVIDKTMKKKKHDRFIYAELNKAIKTHKPLRLNKHLTIHPIIT